MIKTPYKILIDSAEQKPYQFKSIRGDSRHKGKRIEVQTERKHLGAGKADYSIDGYEGFIHIERKSMEDAHSTILGFGKDGDRCRRDRFMEELAFLSSIQFGAVVVESSLETLIVNAPEYGKRSKMQNAKTLFRQVLAWQQDFSVPWIFFWNRESAEIGTFRMLDRFWRKNN